MREQNIQNKWRLVLAYSQRGLFIMVDYAETSTKRGLTTEELVYSLWDSLKEKQVFDQDFKHWQTKI